MSFVKPADRVFFADDKLENKFNSLSDNNWLKKAIKNAIQDFKNNIFSGESIPKKLIPKEYIKKYLINNLWWYPLPNVHRLVYSIVTPSNLEAEVAIIEYFNHKDYERRFHY